eukprot:1868996-Rhodomonas_salina.1
MARKTIEWQIQQQLKRIPDARLEGVLRSLQNLEEETLGAAGQRDDVQKQRSDNAAQVAHDASSGQDRTARDGGWLLRLPHCLLKLIFPAERVVMGLRVCKLLSALAHDVDHLRRRSSVGTADSDDCST